MRNKMNWLMATTALVGICGSTALADDVAPPEYRGEPLSVFAEFDPALEIVNGDIVGDPFESFSDGAIVLGPSSGAFSWVDDADDPSTYLYEGFPPSMTADPSSSGNIYVIEMPNVVDELPIKFLRVQVTWLSPNPTGPGDTPMVGVTGSDPSGPVSVAPAGSFNAGIFSGGSWGGIDVFDFELRPNPDFETIAINTGREDIFIDQVVVDSISIPEPTSLVMLGLGGLLLVGRRR